jgi:hypothetical protein
MLFVSGHRDAHTHQMLLSLDAEKARLGCSWEMATQLTARLWPRNSMSSGLHVSSLVTSRAGSRRLSEAAWRATKLWRGASCAHCSAALWRQQPAHCLEW